MIYGNAPTLPMIEGLGMSSQAGDLREQGVGELTAQISRGAEETFDHFYQHYAPRILRFLLVLTSGNESASRELQQAVVLKAARKMKVFEREEQLWAWLAQIARNEWRDFLRRQARENRVLSIFASAPAPDDTAVDEGALPGYLQTELQHLEPQEQQLVTSFYFEKLSQQEIADQTGRTAKAVQCELSRIRQKLKHAILRRLKNET
jgi:RNA polymerase sigma-70 factor (ECF subfamily)